MKAARTMAEIGWLAVLLAIGCWARWDPAATYLVLGLLVLSVLTLLWSKEILPGRLRPDRLVAILGLFLIGVPMVSRPANSLEFWWLVGSSALLVVCGLVQIFGCPREEKDWHRARKEGFLAGLLALLACGALAGAAYLLLVARSTSPMAPARFDFFYALLIFGGIWFGLDVHLRGCKSVKSISLFSSLFDARHSMALSAAILVMLCRTALA
jgi:hypothetical protein